MTVGGGVSNGTQNASDSKETLSSALFNFTLLCPQGCTNLLEIQLVYPSWGDWHLSLPEGA